MPFSSSSDSVSMSHSPPHRAADFDVVETYPVVTRSRRSSSWWNGRMTSWLDSVRAHDDDGKPAKPRSISSFRPLETFKRPKTRGITTTSIAHTESTDVEKTAASSSSGRAKHTTASHVSSANDTDGRTVSTLYDRLHYAGQMWNLYSTKRPTTSSDVFFYCPIDAALPMDKPIPFFLLPKDRASTLALDSVRISLLRSVCRQKDSGGRPFEDGVTQGGPDALLTVDNLCLCRGVVCGTITIRSGWQACREALFPSLSTSGMLTSFRSRSVCVQYALAVDVEVVPAETQEATRVRLQTPSIMLTMPPSSSSPSSARAESITPLPSPPMPSIAQL